MHHYHYYTIKLFPFLNCRKIVGVKFLHQESRNSWRLICGWISSISTVLQNSTFLFKTKISCVKMYRCKFFSLNTSVCCKYSCGIFFIRMAVKTWTRFLQYLRSTLSNEPHEFYHFPNYYSMGMTSTIKFAKRKSNSGTMKIAQLIQEWTRISNNRTWSRDDNRGNAGCCRMYELLKLERDGRAGQVLGVSSTWTNLGFPVHGISN